MDTPPRKTKSALNLNQMDLNLLRIFDILMHERSVTQTAARCGRSQSAISHSVSRLRLMFNDELFRREGTKMIPTPRAFELAEVVSKALADLRLVVDRENSFEPEISSRNFRIGVSDYTALTFLPLLIEKFSAEAPVATLNILHAREFEVVEQLRRKEVDCVILGNPGLDDPNLKMRVLALDKMVCACWRGNPDCTAMTRETYLAAPHLQISADGNAVGVTDVALQKLNLRRRIAATIPHYLVAPWVLKGTSLITTFGDSVLLALDPRSETFVFEPPIPLPDVALTLVYERYVEADPGHVWLRNLIGRVAQEVQDRKAQLGRAPAGPQV